MRVVAEKRIKTLWPVKLTLLYIPIPNSIVRSPGKVCKMVAALCRIVDHEGIVVLRILRQVMRGECFIISVSG